jgi:hypothetical protein
MKLRVSEAEKSLPIVIPTMTWRPSDDAEKQIGNEDKA